MPVRKFRGRRAEGGPPPASLPRDRRNTRPKDVSVPSAGIGSLVRRPAAGGASLISWCSATGQIEATQVRSGVTDQSGGAGCTDLRVRKGATVRPRFPPWSRRTRPRVGSIHRKTQATFKLLKTRRGRHVAGTSWLPIAGEPIGCSIGARRPGWARARHGQTGDGADLGGRSGRPITKLAAEWRVGAEDRERAGNEGVKKGCRAHQALPVHPSGGAGRTSTGVVRTHSRLAATARRLRHPIGQPHRRGSRQCRTLPA